MDLIDFMLTTDNSTLLPTRTHSLCHASILILDSRMEPYCSRH